MEHLFLDAADISENTVKVPLETSICLLVLEYLDLTKSIQINFILTPTDEPLLTLASDDIKFNVVKSVPLPASLCSTPVFLLRDRLSCVAGLCAVLRQIVRSGKEKWNQLLGFREACLVSCAEVSVWTKFCEVELVGEAKRVLSDCCNSIELREMARLEAHMAQPIRVHNVGKIKEKVHKYAEGPFFLLTDLLLVVPVYLIVNITKAAPDFQLTVKWLNLILEEMEVNKVLQKLFILNDRNSSISWSSPSVAFVSLYKRDPKRYKPREKIFTQQSDLLCSLDILSKVQMVEYSQPLGVDLSLPDVPMPDVPSSRLPRKIQQLNNLTKATIEVSKEKDLIVDFCCGSGHLGLILAHCLPSSTIVLLDNKEKSLDRAREKIDELKLTNVFVVQSNLDYFIGNFQVGVSLHACGVASDLVIKKCLESKANMVVCPCCYGGIQKNHIVEYPQSEVYQKTGLSEKGYIVLGHCADQAGTDQGEKAMQAVDTDRCLLANSYGYTAYLAKLIPPSCTTRNNLIVAVI